MHITERKKLVCKAHILFDSNVTAFQKSQNYGDGEKISEYQGFGRGRNKQVGHGNFRAIKLFYVLL